MGYVSKYIKGERVKLLMQKQGLDIERLAELSGLKPKVVSLVILNQFPPNAEVLWKLATALGVGPDSLTSDLTPAEEITLSRLREFLQVSGRSDLVIEAWETIRHSGRFRNMDEKALDERDFISLISYLLKKKA